MQTKPDSKQQTIRQNERMMTTKLAYTHKYISNLRPLYAYSIRDFDMSTTNHSDDTIDTKKNVK